MAETLEKIQRLIERGEVLISDHGYNELAADGLLIKDVISTVANAVIVEDYPSFPKGPCVLVLQKTLGGDPVHVVWGIPKGASSPAVLVTAYKPDPKRWESDFLRRK